MSNAPPTLSDRPERRGPGRRGAPARHVVTCPVCGCPEAEAFRAGDLTHFRCRACHVRYVVNLGYVVVVSESTAPSA